MKRAINQTSRKVYDVAIIGGGIYGAHVAWDASLRGLNVILVEKGDFSSATSANSQKIIHGGLRYLQHAGFNRMRESIRERSILMRIAPHLVYTMPFLIPFYRQPIWKTLMMSIALRLNDLIGFDRNKHLQPGRIIPNGRMLSKFECLHLCPSLYQEGLNAGMLFYDGQVYNPERLILSILLSASQAGATLVNYAKTSLFVREENSITGFKVEDILTGGRHNVQAKLVINCSGPWNNAVRNLVEDVDQPRCPTLFKAVILVTRPLFQKVAVGLPGGGHYKDHSELITKGYRYFFITPWRHTSLIGTFYVSFDGDPDDVRVTEQEISQFIDEINDAYPAAQIKRCDVYATYCGLLPRAETKMENEDIQYAKNYTITDHETENGIKQILSVVGVKYTTARDVAQKTVTLALKKLGKNPVVCQTAHTPVCGGNIENIGDFVMRALAKKPNTITTDVLEHLIRTYGTTYSEILKYCEEEPGCNQAITDTSPVIKAEIIHAMRKEMAQKLSDVIFRRTELGTAGYPGDACLKTCAAIMREELGWDEARTQNELKETRAVFSKAGCLLS